MTTEFLAENNVCGQTILQIVAEGNTIICELLRLKDYVPELFYLKTKDEQQKYAEIIKDFSYFQIADAQEAKIEADEKLRTIDEELRETCIVTLNRFYIVFESIHKYVKDLNTFIEELNAGLFIQQSMEKVFQDEEGKQLMCEALYLYGMMLLVADLHIPGVVRERILVSYNRYSALKTHSDSSIDEVCKLLRSTGFNDTVGGGSGRKSASYPEDYFARVPINQLYIEMVIGRLRSDDVYNQITVYPLPEQRSTALANQAGMLYVCLFFSPKTLHTQPARMREIVDKFFSDNWIVSLYMGITVNLINAWEPFKAAKTALTNTLDNANLKEISHRQKQSMDLLLTRSRSILREGNLTEQKLLDHMPKVMALVRECNITVRWVMLHTSSTCTFDVGSSASTKRCRQVRELIEQEIDFKGVLFFELLLNTSQLELKIREMLKRLLEEKDDRWAAFRREATDRMQDLADAFSGVRPFVKTRKNDSLSKCFANIRKEIDGLSKEEKHINQTGRTIIQLLQALEEVQDFHGLSKNMQVKQHILETRQFLHEMFHTISIKENDLINLQLIGDFSYAWRLIECYTPMMQENIRRQPRLVIKLRSTFLKLASALEIPLLRLNQAESEHLIDVSKYYSNELANFVRKVVQIIPETMFTILAEIVDLQTNVLRELPARLEKEKMKEYAQFEERFQVAKLTYTLSTFTEGILAMQTTLVGVVELDSKRLLEDGIRRKLVQNVSEAFHQQVVFNAKAKEPELYPRLEALHKIIRGYRRSFEYVQDYLNIHCMRIWNEEMHRIVQFNVEKECQPFLKNKPLQGGLGNNNEAGEGLVPIPIYAPLDMTSINFMGRLAREILRITDPKITVYVDICSSWYDFKTHKLLMTNKFASKINDTIGPAGLMGLDRLYSAMIKFELETFLSTVQKKVHNEGNWGDVLGGIKADLEKGDIVENPTKSYNTFVSSVARFMSSTGIADWLLKIGQKQIIRSHIALELNSSCKIKATKLEASLRTLNIAILLDFKRHRLDESHPIPSAQTVSELNSYLLYAGLYDPYQKVYLKQDSPRFLPLVVFLYVIALLSKFQYMENVDSLVAKKKNESVDGHPLTVALLTLFRQFDGTEMDVFLQYICQYVLSFVHANLEAKQPVGMEALFGLRFLEIFTRVAEIPRSYLEQYLSKVILDQYVFLSDVK
ncbi:WASH complex subunit 5 [Anopheles ziemanni]|uniref:WASH complex subunit 5 n=1 Tax=Anopheles coustani TaxID=139045 RepID=UPI00265831DD|nr:WASH complex subunit 5 [Anopheles coustani]XP_058167414.1 WASH complex subunit 5 [Anopheles ziemanni]